MTFVRISSLRRFFEKKYLQRERIKSDDLHNVFRTHKYCDFCLAVKGLYVVKRKPLERVR